MTKGTKKLARVLVHRGLTDREAAKLLGCSRSVIQRFRHGERVPKGELLFKIEKIFDVAAESFFEEVKS